MEHEKHKHFSPEFRAAAGARVAIVGMNGASTKIHTRPAGNLGGEQLWRTVSAHQAPAEQARPLRDRPDPCGT